ncbi:MAG: hypothetical protein QG657_5159 [Acidobacteriota bacterium]|nr:hypothetical protein [Acidobacteriota bacterium]
MEKPLNLSSIISLLEKSSIVSKIEKVEIDEISHRGFYKIKCNLIPAKYKLEMKFIKTKYEFIYSFQLFTTLPVVRWDNAPHYPDIKTFPHHFHDSEGNIVESELEGNARNDLKKVLSKITELISRSKYL